MADIGNERYEREPSAG